MGRVHTDVHTCRNMDDLRKLKNTVHTMEEDEKIGFYPHGNWMNRKQAIAHLENRALIDEFNSYITMGKCVCFHVAWQEPDHEVEV